MVGAGSINGGNMFRGLPESDEEELEGELDEDEEELGKGLGGGELLNPVSPTLALVPPPAATGEALVPPTASPGEALVPPPGL